MDGDDGYEASLLGSVAGVDREILRTLDLPLSLLERYGSSSYDESDADGDRRRAARPRARPKAPMKAVVQPPLLDDGDGESDDECAMKSLEPKPSPETLAQRRHQKQASRHKSVGEAAGVDVELATGQVVDDLAPQGRQYAPALATVKQRPSIHIASPQIPTPITYSSTIYRTQTRCEVCSSPT